MKSMNLRLILSSVAVAALLVAGGSVQAQIANTKHNLGSTQVDPNNRSDVTDLCVFCHTPHGSDTGASVPLWNRNVSNNMPTYQTYDQLGTSSLDGDILAVGSVSIACLSCHDGTQALDNVLNAPGSGGFTAGTGARIAGATWTSTSGNLNTTTGILNTGVITNMGTDLRNDHPVGIQYGGFQVVKVVGQPAVKIDADFKDPQNATINNNNVWWVDTEATPNGTREKTDMQLYTRTGVSTNEEPYVECASCHDPHTSANPTFLRIDNAGSAVCLACHTK